MIASAAPHHSSQSALSAALRVARAKPLALLGLAALMSACAAPEPVKHQPAPVSIALPPPVAPAPVPVAVVKPVAPVAAAVAREPKVTDLNAYKLVLAEKIAQSNKQAVKNNAPRPNDSVIAGLSVLGLQVRADGGIDRAWVVRSCGDAKLDDLALQSVHAAAPLPAPSEDAMVGRGYTIVAESWLHRTDGKFQLVSKTLTTGSGVPDNLASNKSAKVTTASTPTTKPVVKPATDAGGASITR